MKLALILGGLVAVLLGGLPVFAALGLFAGGLLYGVEGKLVNVGELIFGKLNTYLLVAIPLFTLMANFMVRGKVVDDLYGATNALVRHLPGGLGVATVAACTVFAAISGSSVATAITVGAAAIPQMIRHGYNPRVAYGVVGGGGTLGILIPPSGPMVLFGIVSDTSIGALFIAGIVPGLLLAAIFALWCMADARFGRYRPAVLPRATVAEMMSALRKAFWSLALPVLVLGGMYLGVFTVTEAAAAGALAALIVAAVIYRNLTLRDIWESATAAARTSAMLFLILAAAALLGHVMTKMRIPAELVELVTRLGLNQIEFLLAVMAVIFVLGMFLETISIILITTPVVLPVLTALNIDPVWYGILLTVNLELALITPPVGMNLYTIKAITRAPMAEVILGVMPYVALLLAGLGLVLAFPQIALWLPATMMNLG
ncbi:MAG: TRAP transporter large permease [Alphaproteobacteria bacterium]|nr:TRAP transporter large permease [Alphaproteobacteria bacterium]